MARALLAASKPSAQSATANYDKNFRYYFGLDHWPVNASASKAFSDTIVPQTVRNYLFATVDYKTSVVTDATPRLRAEPLDGFSTQEQREKAAQATRHDLERAHWNDIGEDLFITGSVNELGIAMLRMEQDKLSGEYKCAWDMVDQRRLYYDPSATRFYNCDYVNYEPEVSLAFIQQQWPEKAHKIQPKKTQPVGQHVTDNGRARTDAEIINAPGTELSIDDKGDIRQRVADVCYTWIKSDELFEDTRRTITREAMAAAECQDCMLRFEPGLTEACPNCGSVNIKTVEVPEAAEEYTVITRKYPFGRLIITCQDVLLYDGPSQIELDCIFPFVVYTHYRDPRKIRGSSDLLLLKSNQMQADKNASRLFQAMGLTGQGYLEIPTGEPGWQNATNELGTKIPTKPENMGKARWVTVGGYNVQLHSVADNTIFSDFQRISGQTDQAVSQMPSAPDSATEVKSRDSVKQSRMGRHLKNWTATLSQMATMHWQAMCQYYVGPRPFMFSENGSQFESVVLDVSQMPRNLRIRVEIDIDAAEKDKNLGQNLIAFIQSGGMESPYAPVFLRLLGTPEAMVNELMSIQAMVMQQQQVMALAAMSGQGNSPNGTSPAPPVGAGPPQQAPKNEGAMN